MNFKILSGEEENLGKKKEKENLGTIILSNIVLSFIPLC